LSLPTETEKAILDYLTVHPKTPFEKGASEIAESGQHDLDLVKRTIREFIGSGRVLQRRHAGLMLPPTQQRKGVTSPPKRRKTRRIEHKFHKKTMHFMKSRLEWDYGDDTSEKEKHNPMAAVPDVAGIKYSAGYLDRVDLYAVEVKTEKPKSYHLSEAFRYSRFADFCFVAIAREETEEGRNAGDNYRNYLLKARRLGLGIIEYPMESRQRLTPELKIEATRQNPDVLEKARFLAKSLGIFQCMQCGCCFHEKEGEKTPSIRSKKLLESRWEDEKTAERFTCNTCLGKRQES
jgi:hypothetical protein